MVHEQINVEENVPSMGPQGFESWPNDIEPGEWRDVDRELRSIARRQSGLDAELMRALREADRVELWRHLGCVSMLEYLERVFGYGPRVAQERLRTARRLAELTDLGDALEQNELPFSAVRELTRVATPQTQAAWCAAARGKCLREIEEMVAGLEPGDLPGERKRPDLMRVRLSYDEIETSTQALERQARHMIESERGERLDDNAFLSAVFQLALGAASSEQGVGDRAKFQIVHYQCDSCGAAAQLGGGVKLPVAEADIDRARCDAEHVSLEAPGRPTQDIPKKVRRFVELRDGKRCRIPGCRSTRNLDIHHIEHQEDGGTHEPPNLIVICGGHHDAHHRGVLWISGTASQLVIKRFDDPVNASAHVGVEPAPPPTRSSSARSSDAVNGTADVKPAPRAMRSKSTRLNDAVTRTHAITALVTMGWDRKTSGTAVDSALADLGGDPELIAVITAALRRCK